MEQNFLKLRTSIIYSVFAFLSLLTAEPAMSSGTSGGSPSGGASGSSGSRAASTPNTRAERAREEMRARISKNTKQESQKYDPLHTEFSKILSEHVRVLKEGSVTQVNYAKINREILKNYLKTLSDLSRNQFDTLSKAEQLAFLINAYNAYTIELILEHSPKKSIKEIGFIRSPWSIKFVPLLGELVSLDEIEHGLIRGSKRYNDPRIHFAVNCASIGCPALRNEAFVASRLDTQLEESTIVFLKDRERNRYNAEKQKLEVSSIFKWYRGDFENGARGFKRLSQFFAQYADHLSEDPVIREKIRQESLKIDFLDYDWNLNRVP